jgi:hypothetical protein
VTAISIVLDYKDKLAEGAGRVVFNHPHRDDLILKIHKPHRKRPFMKLRNALRANRRKYSIVLYSMIEAEEIARAIGRMNSVPKCVAQFLGFTNTNLGPAALFEAIKGLDGGLAPTLYTHARKHGYDPRIEAAIKTLWDEIATYQIAISDLGLPNTVVRGDAETGYDLVIIDGMGDRTMIPLQRFAKWIYLAIWRKRRAQVLANYRRTAQAS